MQANSTNFTLGVVHQLPEVCSDFPQLPTTLVSRDNILMMVENLFAAHHPLVVMQGDEGIGNTTLLAQFVNRHPKHAISLFVRPKNSLFYNLRSLRFDLCNQIHWVLRGIELDIAEEADDGLLEKLYHQLATHARRTNQTYYFVVDGIADIPENDIQLRPQIMGLLRWNTPRFHVLLSGNKDRLPLPESVSAELVRNVPFSLGDARLFFGDSVTEEVVAEANRVCGGMPGRLEVLKTLFAREDPQAVLSELGGTLSDVFELSWRQLAKVKNSNSPQEDALLEDALALMAHGRRTHSLDNLARILECDPKALQSLLGNLSFVWVETQEVKFVSDAFRRFAADKLRALRKRADDLHIDDLLRHREEASTSIDLVLYYKQAERFKELLAYLDSEAITQMLATTGSLTTVQTTAEVGMAAAREMGSDEDLLRLSVQKSTLHDLSDAQMWRDEAEARLALSDYDSAFALAQSSVLNEDKLHLLALIARSKSERDLPIEPELTDNIERLCEVIEPEKQRDRAMQIASDLLLSHPDLATDIVKRASSADPDENALTYALAEISFSASRQHELEEARKEGKRPEASLEKLSDQVEDPAIRQFLGVASLVYGHGRFSATDILRRVEDLEDAGTRIFILSQWCVGNTQDENAAKVVSAALQTLINCGLYVVSVRDLREIGSPLPFLTDLEETRRLVGEFDAIHATIELAAFEEDIALRLLLTRAETRYDPTAARDRLEDIYLVSYYHDDIAVKAACLGRFVAALEEIDPGHALEDERQMHSTAQSDLREAFKELLYCTSDHYDATRSIIRALARTQPEMALEFVPQLNTVTRRDNALVEFVEAAVRVPLAQLGLNLEQVDVALGRIENPNLQDFALVETIKRLAAIARRERDAFPLNKAASLLRRIEAIPNLESRCISCCHAWLLQHDLKREGELTQNAIETMLASAWDNFDAQWQKITAGFKIAALLGESSTDLGRQYIQKTEELRAKTVIDNGVSASSYMQCVHLSIRAFSGLLPSEIDMEDDIVRLYNAIEDLPSKTDRIRLLTDLALRCHVHKRVDFCRDIVEKLITPLINSLADLKEEYQHHAISFAAPALYATHHESALQRIDNLPLFVRDDALDRICRFLLTNKAPFDPIEKAPGRVYPIPGEAALEICYLLDKIDNDSIIYGYIVDVVDSAVASSTLITRAQKTLLLEALDKLIACKFPNPRYIRHQGWVVSAEAQLTRLRVHKKDVWPQLQQKAATIENKADVAFVLGIIGSAMASAGASESDKKSVFSQAETVVESIPLPMDRADHYYSLMTLAKEDKTLREMYAAKVLEISIEAQHPKSRALQTQVIDYIHRYDPQKAAEMASQGDNDPARENLRRRVEMLDFKNDLVKEKVTTQDFADAQRQCCVNAAWVALGQLNSGYSSHCHHLKLQPYIEISGGGAMKDAYRILSYVIENANNRYASTAQAREFLRPAFEAMMQGTQMSLKMANRQSQVGERVRRNAPGASGNAPGDVIIIENGERQKALDFLTTWLSDEAIGYLKICDCYLTPQDVCEILLLVQRHNPGLKVKFLMGPEGLSAEQLRDPKSALIDSWVSVCGQDPPDTKIVLCYTRGSKKSPIHDRWWLSEGGGLKPGTSLNGLGCRVSDIARISVTGAVENERLVDSYIDGHQELHDAEALRYEAFSLYLD